MLSHSEALRDYDKRQTGKVASSVLKSIVVSHEMDHGQALKLIAKLDPRGDGNIGYVEVSFVYTKRRVWQSV